MTRIPFPDEGVMTPEQQKVVEAVVSGPRGMLVGPLRAALHRPDLAEVWQRFGAMLRYGTSLPPHLSELAILVTARLWRAQYEWYAHAPVAERAGLKPQTIRELHRGRVPKSARKDERAVYDLIRELYRTRRVSERTFRRVEDVLGTSATVELVGILGYYALISMILNVFRMPLPEGEPLPFPE